MSSAVVEEILEEAKALSPEEQRQLQEVLRVLGGEEVGKGMVILLLVAGLFYVLEKRNALPHEKRQRLSDLLNQEAVDSGLVDRASVVHAVRGKYAHLRISSEEFAAQKREEIKLEDHG
jgi:hypothetical protein